MRPGEWASWLVGMVDEYMARPPTFVDNVYGIRTVYYIPNVCQGNFWRWKWAGLCAREGFAKSKPWGE